MKNVIVVEIEDGIVTAVNCTSGKFQVFLLEHDADENTRAPYQPAYFTPYGSPMIIAHNGPMIQDIEKQMGLAEPGPKANVGDSVRYEFYDPENEGYYGGEQTSRVYSVSPRSNRYYYEIEHISLGRTWIDDHELLEVTRAN